MYKSQQFKLFPLLKSVWILLFSLEETKNIRESFKFYWEFPQKVTSEQCLRTTKATLHPINESLPIPVQRLQRLLNIFKQLSVGITLQ